MKEYYLFEIKKAVTVKLDEVQNLAKVSTYIADQEDQHECISYEDGLKLIASDSRFIEKNLSNLVVY